MPQAASPIAFALLALAPTGVTAGGAALVLAMTLAQVVAVVAISRLGQHFVAVEFLRTLVLLRSLALVGLALGAWYEVLLGVLTSFSSLRMNT